MRDLNRKSLFCSKRGGKWVNYESELSELLWSKLMEMYGVEEQVLFHYFYLRFLIEHYDKKIESINRSKRIVDFLVTELNIPVDEEGFTYKGEKIKKYYAIENCLENIVVNWEFQTSLKDVINSKGNRLPYKEYIQKEWKRIFMYGKNKAKSFRETSYYSIYVKWNSLYLLNQRFQANVVPPKRIEGIEYPSHHHFLVRTLEEKYEAEIHAVERMTSNTSFITENDLEQYLIKNLHLIEEGLQYIDRQYSIKDGRIDILARDKNRQYVIIELKVQEDKEIIWQSLFYPMQFKKEHKVDKVRMITLAPQYPNHILTPLKQIEGIEIMQFSPLIELGKIKNLTISKVS